MEPQRPALQRSPSATPTPPTVQPGMFFDNSWTVAATLAAFVLINLPLQHRLWTLFGGDRTPGIALPLGLLGVALGALALSTYLAPQATSRIVAQLSAWLAQKRRLTLSLLVGAAVLMPAAVAYFVLDRFQNSGDEYAYYFQAGQFATGHLSAKAPPLGDAFVPYRTWIIGDRWVSQYPPGWPLVLATAMVAGIPTWCVNAILGALLVSCLLSTGWRLEDRSLPVAAVALLVPAPFYVLNAASYYSHVLTALLISLACLACLWYQRDHRVLALVSCGALLGIIGLTRYFSLLLLFPALAYWLYAEGRGNRVHMIVLPALAGLPFLIWLLAYQYWITGNPLHSTYSLITADDVYVSFKLDAVLRGARLTFDRLVELSVWASPLLLPAYAFCLLSKMRSRSLAFYDLIFPCFVVGYVLFADAGGNRYGPRYYFDAFPLALMTIVSAAPGASAWVRRLTGRPIAESALLVSAAYLLIALPFACRALHAQVVKREALYRLASSVAGGGAIVVVEASSGRGLEPEDLARNDAGLRAPVLYARSGTSLANLHRAFPDRSIWIYKRNPEESSAHLEIVLSGLPSRPGDLR